MKKIPKHSKKARDTSPGLVACKEVPEVVPDPAENSDWPALEYVVSYLDNRRKGVDSETVVRDAWDKFYHKVSPFIYNVVRLHCSLEIDRDDAIQEAWRTLLHRLNRHRGEADWDHFRNWLFILIRNRMIDLNRSAARRRRVALNPRVAASLIAREEDPAIAHERTQVMAVFRDFLESSNVKVSDASLRVLRLRWIEGESIMEVASRLGMTAAQVRDRSRRALKAIRDMLKDHSDGGLISIESGRLGRKIFGAMPQDPPPQRFYMDVSGD